MFIDWSFSFRSRIIIFNPGNLEEFPAQSLLHPTRGKDEIPLLPVVTHIHARSLPPKLHQVAVAGPEGFRLEQEQPQALALTNQDSYRGKSLGQSLGDLLLQILQLFRVFDVFLDQVDPPVAAAPLPDRGQGLLGPDVPTEVLLDFAFDDDPEDNSPVGLVAAF